MMISISITMRTEYCRRCRNSIIICIFSQQQGSICIQNQLSHLYKQKSRAYIEYASHWFHFASEDIQTMQNKYLRLAAPTKRSTPLDLLHNLHKVSHVRHRVNSLRCRMWLPSIYSSSFHPLVKTRKKLQNLLRQISSGKFRTYRPKATSHYLYKSPLYVAMKTFMETATHFAYPVPRNPPPNPITAMPTYSLPIIPSGYRVIVRECNPLSHTHITLHVTHRATKTRR
eukprot:262754_1